jgi:predicted DNA-binding transcriptional regulator AlpA
VQQYNPFESLPDAGFTRIRVVAAHCGVVPASIYNWVKAGRLPKPMKIGPNASGFPNRVLKEFGANLAKGTE